MKRSILVLVATFLVAMVFAQNNQLFWTMRVTVKMDKKAEWEKKAPMLMKAHYPQYDFKVYEVTTGPNTGSYVLTIGPMSYKDMDTPPVFPKGEVAARNDGMALDALSESVEVTHYRLDETSSRVIDGRQNKYARMTFAEMHIGSWDEVQGFFKKVRQVQQNNDVKNDVRIFRPVNSGTVNRFVIARNLEKWEELEETNSFQMLYDKEHGPNAWYIDRASYLSKLKSIEAELWVLRSDLSTRKSI